MSSSKNKITIREALESDFDFVVDLMVKALSPYYGGDHRRHAERIFQTHISGGKDKIGFFSTFQKMYIAELDKKRAGMIHLVGKRQGTTKISPLIVKQEFRKQGIGKVLLDFAENYACEHSYRQIYCTVAQQNVSALSFFKRNEYIVTGRSDSHYKVGITELMLYKPITTDEEIISFDKEHISVLPYDDKFEHQVRKLLLERLASAFVGINDAWVDSLFEGYKRGLYTNDINLKYKLIFLAVDRQNKVRGVVGATPKKGAPIKLMPFIATDMPSFIALLRDVPFYLKRHGRKLYIHLSPTAEETIALQQCGWMLNAAMPAAYHPDLVTQQWSFNIDERKTMRSMRVKDKFLKFIQAGKKDLEVRVGYKSFKNIKVGELINFNNRNRSVVGEVVDIRNYNTFEEMLNSEDPNRIVPGTTKDGLLKLLKDIYPESKEKLGVIVLQIDVKK